MTIKAVAADVLNSNQIVNANVNPKRVIFHVDDSRLTQKQFKAIFEESQTMFELYSFSSSEELLVALKELETPPAAIFSDWHMPGMDGFELLNWLKRHPKYHYVPVAMLTAEKGENEIASLKATGCHKVLSKPIIKEDLLEMLSKVEGSTWNPEIQRQLDLDFVEETQRICEEAGALLKTDFNEESYKTLYRYLHTLKGGAATCQLPVLSGFIHKAESVLSLLRGQKLYQAPAIKDFFTKLLSYIEAQADRLRMSEIIEVAPLDLVELETFISTGVHSGWLQNSQSMGPQKSAPDVGALGPEPTGQPSPHILSKNTRGVRVTNDSLDAVQGHLKKIVQIRTRLSKLVNDLKSEFPDESFPSLFDAQVKELNSAASASWEYFIGLRVISANRLKNLVATLVDQTSRALGKSAKAEFVASSWVEVDQNIYNALEGALTHLIRNSMDHGLENSSEREKLGKDPVGSIQVKIELSDASHLKMTLSDDGAGINEQKLKQSLLKNGLLNEKILANMSRDALLGMIFVDGVSSKDNVTELSGRGVGLAAVKKEIEDLGGKIQIHSELTKGSTFVIECPRIFKL